MPTPDTDKIQIAKLYNEHAKQYHQSRTQGRLFNEYLEMPHTLSLIAEDLSGLKVLDAGCGSGIYAQILAQRGATVIGVDISEAMLAIAKKNTPATLSIEYQLGDLAQLSANIQNIDLILCNYVLENNQDIASIFQKFYQALAPNGTFIFSVSHPLRATATPCQQNDKEIWQLEDYFSPGIRISNLGQGLKIKKYKRTFSDYLTQCLTAGFTLEQVLEPQPIAQGQAAHPIAYEMATRLPNLLLIKACKH